MTTFKKAVALKYDKTKDLAPKTTAKGQGSIARQIIKIAQQNDIPIKQDEDLVQMLSQIELNQNIPEELYQAVAELFNFIYGLTNEKI